MRITKVRNIIFKFLISFVLLQFILFSIISFYYFSLRIKGVELKTGYYHLIVRGVKNPKGFELYDLRGRSILSSEKKTIFNVGSLKEKKPSMIFLKNGLCFYIKDSKKGRILVYRVSLSEFALDVLLIPFILSILSFLSLFLFFKIFRFEKFHEKIAEGLKIILNGVKNILNNKPPKTTKAKFIFSEFEEIQSYLSDLYKKILLKENEWKVSFKNWRKVADKFPLILVFVEEGKRIISFNLPAKKFFGDEIKEFLSVEVSGLKNLKSNLKNVYEYSKSFSLKNVKIKGRDGKEDIFDILLIPLEVERKKGVLIIGQNKSERIQIETLFTSLLKLEDRGVIISDDQGNIINFNPKILEIFSMTEEELKEKSVYDIFKETDIKKLKDRGRGKGDFTFFYKEKQKIVKVYYLLVSEQESRGKLFLLIEDISKDISFREDLRFMKILRAISSESNYLMAGRRVFKDSIVNIARILNFEKVCLFKNLDGKTFELEDEVIIEGEGHHAEREFSKGDVVNFRKMPILKTTLMKNRVVFFSERTSEKSVSSFMKRRKIKHMMAFPVSGGAEIKKFVVFVNYSKKIEFSTKEKDLIWESLRFLEVYFKIREYKKILKHRFSSILQIYDNLEEPIYIVDPDTYEIVYKNKGFTKIFGKKTEGKKCYEIVYKRSKVCFNCIIRNKDKEILEWEDNLRLFEDNYYVLHQKFIKLSEGKKLILNLFVDVTEKMLVRKRAEQAQKKELLGDLIGGLSHDMNNILSGMSGYLELLELSNSEEKRQDYLMKIKNILEKAHKMVFQTLNFSRETGDTLQIEKINKIIDDALIIIEPSLPKNINLKKEISKEYFVKANSNQLMQVFLNMLTNARDALEERENGEILVKLDSVMIGSADAQRWNVEKRRYVVVSIKDNGEGIDKKNLNKIFEPFFSTKKADESKGSGVGLYITKKIVNAHGGFIKVSSVKGKGTTFSIYLPQYETKVSESKEEKMVSLPSELKAMFEGDTIILSDGDVFPELLQQLLEYLGLSTFNIRNWSEAKEIAKKENVRFLFIDMSILKEREPEFFRFINYMKKHTEKIIYLSSVENSELEGKLKEKYGIKILSKPFSIYSLSNLLISKK